MYLGDFSTTLTGTSLRQPVGIVILFVWIDYGYDSLLQRILTVMERSREVFKVHLNESKTVLGSSKNVVFSAQKKIIVNSTLFHVQNAENCISELLDFKIFSARVRYWRGCGFEPWVGVRVSVALEFVRL